MEGMLGGAALGGALGICPYYSVSLGVRVTELVEPVLVL